MAKDRRLAIAAVTAGTALALSWTPAIAIAANVDGPVAIATAPDATVNLPKTIEFHKKADQIESGKTYTLVSSTTPGGGKKRIIHLTPKTTKLDRCEANNAGDKLTPIDCTAAKHQGKHTHEWTVAESGNGFTIKSNADSKYINLTKNGAVAGDNPQELSIVPGQNGGFVISAVVENSERFLAYTNSGWTSTTSPYEVLVYQRTEILPKVVPNVKAMTGTTQGRPFAPGTGGSQNFRIPALITGMNPSGGNPAGTLYAAIDARWNHTVDARNIDTIFSYSTDNGANWNFSFPNYFPDSAEADFVKATTFIDPLMVEKDGVLYMLVDLWPGGIALANAQHENPVKSSGFVEIEGKQRLVLFNSPSPHEQRKVGAERGVGYTHYIGDFADDGYAPVIKKDGGATTHYVDRDYYLFDANKNPLYCRQLANETAYVQQNVFFYNANLHVAAGSHLVLKTSQDGGKTWSHPTLLNSQVRTGLSESNASFYGLGPGRGLVTSTGRIVVPCYTYIYGQGDGKASVIYSDDNGVTWHRGAPLKNQTSEATVVEVDGVLYMFARHGWYATSRDGGETWQNEKSLRAEGIDVYAGCQINAITYSKLVDGKPAILLSAPTGNGRTNGKIFVGLVGQDGSIDWKYQHNVEGSGNGFAYSCLTERNDGKVSLLWEGANNASNLSHFTMEQIAPNAEVSNTRKLSVAQYGEIDLAVSSTFSGFEGKGGDVAKFELVPNGTTATFKVEGLQAGTVSFTDPGTKITYEVTVVPAEVAETVVDVNGVVAKPVVAGVIKHQPDTAIAKVEIAEQSYAEAWGDVAGALGSDSQFNGEAKHLGTMLYTFTKNGDGWKIEGKLADGSSVFLNMDGNKLTSPNKKVAHRIQVGQAADGTFTLRDAETANSPYLHFYRDGQARFDRNSALCTDGSDNFELYRRAQDAKASAIPGYERVETLDQIKDGESYLIVAAVGTDRYVLHPSSENTTGHAHVAKVDLQRQQKVLKITGVTPGVTTAVVDGVAHRITVAGYLAPSFTWAEDFSSAKATFQHTAGGADKVLDCKVTSVRTEPTASAEGSIVYTATVEFEGKAYTSVKTVVLPALGEPGGGENQGGQDQGQDQGNGQGQGTDQDNGQDQGHDNGQGGNKPQPGKPQGGSGAGKPADKLPVTGDPAAVVGGMSALGALLGSLGFTSRKRKQ